VNCRLPRPMASTLPAFGMDPEVLGRLETLTEEIATLEIPAPIHYPPSPPGDIQVYDFAEERPEEEEPVQGFETRTTGPRGLSFSFACGGWLQVSHPNGQWEGRHGGADSQWQCSFTCLVLPRR
jgi:hypothetical protein